MRYHYSKPKGFVGRNICYAVTHEGLYYGHIVAGSATRHLPGRHDFIGTSDSNLCNIINNIFFNVSPVNGRYPIRNFTTSVVNSFVDISMLDWRDKYGDDVLGFETLIQKPRTGELYRRAGWTLVGETIGYTCKREGGKGTDSWTGRRVWNTVDLKPKLVYCLRVSF